MTLPAQHTGKAIAIGILVVLFVIPSLMVSELVNERSMRRDQVVMEVSNTWSNAQTIQGPVLGIPYVIATSDSTGVTTQRTEYAFFLPEELTVHGKLTSEIRSRGIYDAPVYTTALDVRGRFTQPNIAALGIAPAQMRYDQAFLAVGIPDMRGVANRMHVSWNGSSHAFVPGGDVAGLASGVRSDVPVIATGKEYSFSFALDLKGSRQLSFLPAGKTTEITLEGDWSTPSFYGAFLPASRSVTTSGFTATWKVLDLNRSFPQQWTGNTNPVFTKSSDANPVVFRGGEEWAVPTEQLSTGMKDEFGVRLFQASDVYTASMRATKYAMAVIALVFAVMFFIEAMGKRRVHPVQYTLIGLALVIFYTLLLSLSEYISFGWAYLISTIAVVGMVTTFARRVTGDGRRGLLTGGILLVLYVFTYILLLSEDYTLLIGSIGLFLILAAMMWASNKVKWYGEESSK